MTQAPYQYIHDYYQTVHDKAQHSTYETSSWMSCLKAIQGNKVLNVGCGPTFYDYIPFFGAIPQVCVGLDINKSTFDFMRDSDDPNLLSAKQWVEGWGTRIETICDDVFNCEERLAGQFDYILGVGFFAGFHNNRFDELMRIMRGALTDEGKLMKISWHGPHRPQSKSWEKLQYCYESVEATDPEQLILDIECSGFTLEHLKLIECDPEIYGWDTIQACRFKAS